MSEEIKATQENTKETKKGFAELKKALIDQNKKSADRAVADFRKQQIADKKAVEKINRQIKTELAQAQELKKISDNLEKANFATPQEKEAAAKRAQIAKELVSQTIEERKILRVTRDTRKLEKDSRSDARKSLDLEKNSLSALQKQIEDSGGIAEDNLEFRRAQNRIRRQELTLRKSEATSPAARKEIRKEQRKELINAFKLAIAPVSERLGGLLDSFKSIAGTSTGIPGLSLGRLAFLAAIPFIVKFLDSETFKNLKETIIKNVIPALDFFYNKLFLPVATFIKGSFTNTFKNIKEAIFGVDGQGGPGSLSHSLELFKKGDVFGGLKNTVSTLFNFFVKEIDDNLTKLVKEVLQPLFGFEMIGEGESFFGVIGRFFQKLRNIVVDFFTLERFANLYDQLLPDAPSSLNPFRQAMKNRDEAALNRREEATYGKGTQDDPFGVFALQRFLGVPQDKMRETFNTEAFIANFGEMLSAQEIRIIKAANVLTDKREVIRRLKAFRESTVATQGLGGEMGGDLSTLDFDDKQNRTVVDDLTALFTFFKKENEKVKENAKILLESNAEIVRQRVEGMRLTLLANEIKKMEDERALNLIKQQQLQDSNLGGFFSMPVITDGRVTNNAKTIAPMLVTETDQFISHGLNSVGGFSRP